MPYYELHKGMIKWSNRFLFLIVDPKTKNKKQKTRIKWSNGFVFPVVNHVCLLAAYAYMCMCLCPPIDQFPYITMECKCVRITLGGIWIFFKKDLKIVLKKTPSNTQDTFLIIHWSFSSIIYAWRHSCLAYKVLSNFKIHVRF